LLVADLVITWREWPMLPWWQRSWISHFVASGVRVLIQMATRRKSFSTCLN
jgi:hypothetical protein